MENRASSSEAVDHSEKRRHVRYDCDIAASFVAGGEKHAILMKNVSQGGAFIELVAALTYEERGLLILDLPRVKGSSEIPSVVRWVAAGGVGLQFLQVTPLQVWGLNNLIEALRAGAV